MSNTESVSNEEVQKRIELMKENCIFCKIVRDEIPSKKIHEDDTFIAFLDINPVTNGHTVLIPKEHYMLISMVPDEILGKAQILARQIAELLKESLGANDVTIIIPSGQAAGQQIQHFAIHLIPRYDGDKLDLNLENEERNEEELKVIRDDVVSKLNSQNF